MQLKKVDFYILFKSSSNERRKKYRQIILNHHKRVCDFKKRKNKIKFSLQPFITFVTLKKEKKEKKLVFNPSSRLHNQSLQC